jgi:hypothetical protein
MNSWVTALRSTCSSLANNNNQSNTNATSQPSLTQTNNKPAQASSPSKVSDGEDKVGLDDFEIKKVVGKGSFGKVCVAIFLFYFNQVNVVLTW